MTVFQALVALATLILLSGCSTLSPYSQVTKLDLTLTASDQLNPDINGRPSPLVIRLLELKHPAAFENADFFSLYQRAGQTLGTDLVNTEELELRPGETVELKLSLVTGSRYVGILAGYRDLLGSDWRHTVQVTPMAISQAELTLDRNALHPSVPLQAQARD